MELNVKAALARPAASAAQVPRRVRNASPSQAKGTRAASGRDRVRITYADVLTATRDGYIEVQGEKIPVPEDAAQKIQEAFEKAQAQNEAVSLANQFKQDAYASQQQIKAAKEYADAIKKAMKIFHRIASGGRVPGKDEKFLMDFSDSLYMAAKTAALMAKKHKKYKSALNDEEQEEDGAPELDESRYAVDGVIEEGADGAEFTGAEVAAVEGDAPL